MAVQAHQENGVLLRIRRQQVEPLSHLLSGKATGIVRVQMASPFEGLNGGYRQRATQRKTEAVTRWSSRPSVSNAVARSNWRQKQWRRFQGQHTIEVYRIAA